MVVVHVADAVVTSETIAVDGTQDGITTSSHSQVLEVGVKERKKEFWDDAIQVNSLMDPSNEANATRFSLAYWATTLTIAMVILAFSICIVFAIVDEYRPEGILCCHCTLLLFENNI